MDLGKLTVDVITLFNTSLSHTVMKHYSSILTMLLRLRQLVLHPILIVRKEGEAGHANDLMLDAGDDPLHMGRGLSETFNREIEIQRVRSTYAFLAKRYSC